MKAIFSDLRIFLAEYLLCLARDVMPEGADEHDAMVRASDAYFNEAVQIQRWGKFPA